MRLVWLSPSQLLKLPPTSCLLGRLSTESTHSFINDLLNPTMCHGLFYGTKQIKPSFREADIPVKRDIKQRRETYSVSADSRTRKTRNNAREDGE